MNPYTRVIATREGGAVRRCHTFPTHRENTNGQHSFNAASLILHLHPNPSLDLVKAMLWHDVAERWTGDLPAPAKWLNPTLGEEYAKAEREVFRKLGIQFNLTEDEERWLHACDKLELLLFCREEEAMGNRYMEMRVDALENWFSDHRAEIPAEVAKFMEEVPAWYVLKEKL